MTTRVVGRVRALAPLGIALCLFSTAAPSGAACVGDCDGSNSVAINELILGVNIALGSQPITNCPAFDCENDQTVPINCLIQGVNNALNGCPAGGTPTDTPSQNPPTPTVTPEGCPLSAGQYTVTQVAGGALKVYSFQPFPFPAGGTIVEDVGAASPPDCVHDVVVPFPGGFDSPNFCVPALGFTVSVTQSGCGIGKIDSNGGSDFTVTEISDTSDSSATCNLPQMGCPPGPPAMGSDASSRVDITVGDGTADTCASGGTANALVTIPVHTKTWLDNSPGMFGICNGDGVFNDGDAIVTEFNQILDFTTDTTKSHWADIDGDGCVLAGTGPLGGEALITGTCIDLVNKTLTSVASGGFGSTGGPTFDGSFSTMLPATVAMSGVFAGTTCATAPAINFTGTATRCLK